jgi:hypothetical protein
VTAYPPDPCVVHPLPPAPHFVGREPELNALRACRRDGFRGVLALVGLGGAGKTAVAAHFVEELLQSTDFLRPDGLFVWSFYQQPDAGLFLQEAYRYFARGAAPATSAKGSGILHLLHDALATGGPHLLVLDGLERVQRQESTGAYGQIEDPVLKALLVRLAERVGQVSALVTSRFPLTDLAPFHGQTYRSFDLCGLDPAAARGLLRRRGVEGDDNTLTDLIDNYGAHALTLDHLGGVIGQFLGGDARRAPEAPALAAPGSDRQALRLARLFRAYEEHLPPEELALLCRLCLLRRSVTDEQIAQLFLCSPAVHARTVRELHQQIRHMPVPKEELAPDLANYAEAVSEFLEEILCAAPIAGPEDQFRQEILQATTKAIEMQQAGNDFEFAELAHLYGATDLDVQTDRRPLSAEDRETLRGLCASYLNLGRDLLMPVQVKMDPTLELAFEKLGWKRLGRRRGEDFRPDDLLYAYKRVRQRLWHLAGKHFVLRRVHELTDFYQRKWSLAGPLAPLDAADLRRVLDALVGRHLAAREADGSFSIHPAVRDYFYRVAIADRQIGWHDLLREQMVTLIQQPGHRLPNDPATLDLVEEAIYHALQAGRADEATFLYRDVLGGMRHLAWKLGEMARGLRILRGFDPCPDRDALAWFLRALGEFDEAYTRHTMPYFRADLRLLQGRLPEVAAEDEDARSAAAAFLMGQTSDLPPDLLACAVPRDQLLLYLGRLDVVRHTEGMKALYQHIGWEGDRARHRLFLAEVARRRADPTGCRKHLHAAAGWILHSGSVEHLCLMHLFQARLARDTGDHAAAQRALEEGLFLARRCGLRLYHVELLCEQAEGFLAEWNAQAAEAAAREALHRASADDCRFLWGAAEAGHLLGKALYARKDPAALATLEGALDLRRRLADPRAEQTERFLTLVREQNAGKP